MKAVMMLLMTIAMVSGDDYINVALGKPAKQKDNFTPTTEPPGNAEWAVDGNRNSDYYAASCSHTAEFSLPTWWMVDLLGQYKVEAVRLTNRNEIQERLQQFSVHVSNTNPQKHPGFPNSLPGQQCVYHGPIVYGTETFPCSSPLFGRYVLIYKDSYEDSNDSCCLTLCEVEVLVPTGSMIIQTEFTLLHKNTRSSHPILHSLSGISTVLRCGMVCMKVSEGSATLIQHHETSQLCECIRISEFDTSDYLTYSDTGWNLYSSTN